MQRFYSSIGTNRFCNSGRAIRTTNAFLASHRCRSSSGFGVGVDVTITNRSRSSLISITAMDGDGNNSQIVEAKNKVETSEFLSDENKLLMRQHTFEVGSYLDIDYFNKLVEEGLCKKIDENFCQDNRDYKYSGKAINHDKKVVLNQTLDTELVRKGHREPVYYAVENGEVLAQTARIRHSKMCQEGELIGRFSDSQILERVVRVLKKSYADGYYMVSLNHSFERVGVIVLATFVGNRPHGLTVDHINGIRDDDRIYNLRWATKSEQEFNKGRRSKAFPFGTMEETGCMLYYQHPMHQHLFISESSPFIFCWNDITKRFIQIYQLAKPIFLKTIDIGGRTYPVKQLIREARNNKRR